MSTSKNWFEVDHKGLTKILGRRKKGFILLELVQNAWDEPGVHKVELSLEQNGRGLATFTISDDSPNGFADLSHAYTMFAESPKKDNPEQRGRFNIGEKMVFAIAKEATVKTTKGSIRFDKGGRHRLREQRQQGSEIVVTLQMNQDEFNEANQLFNRLIVPRSIRMTVNGKCLGSPKPIRAFECLLPTEIAEEDGILRNSTRKTTVTAYAANGSEPAAIYEMGIPVCDIDMPWLLDVGQKIPLTLDRENVSEGFKRKLGLHALNGLHDIMGAGAFSAPWVKQATEHPEVSDDAMRRFLDETHGKQIVSRDPSDPEANARAVAAGYTVVEGGSLSGKQWDHARRAGLIKPASQVTPSPKVWTGDDDPDPRWESPIPKSKWTPEMTAVSEYAIRVAKAIIDCEIQVLFFSSAQMLAAAAYAPGQLQFNKLRLGSKWFDLQKNRLGIDSLLIHEFGHHYESNHLSKDYYNALTDIAARFIQAVREKRL